MALPNKNMEAVQRAIRDLLVALGEDPEREGLKDTPLRVSKMYSEILDGNFVAMKEMTSFEGEVFDQGVMVTKVPFYAFCEHHLLMFTGTFGMAYVPRKKVLGLSKLVRIFRFHTKRPTIQERITQQAVDSLMRIADPVAACCYVKAEHTCMSLRGVKSPGAMTTTIADAVAGNFDKYGLKRDTLWSQFVAEASK